MNSPIFFSEALVQALGWTLVHALWQGAVIALALWFILPRLKRAGLRYWVSYAALCSVFGAAVGTFAWVYNSGHATTNAPETAAITIDFTAATAATAPAVETGLWSGLAAALEPYHPAIVSVWLLGFCFFLFQLLTGFHFVYRLRHRQNRLLAPEWQEKLQRLAARLGLSRPVKLLESALVNAPMAIGFFKPLILLPVGMATQLTPAEVEAVLAHELAHIARRDWLFNLIQAFIEALFYFHPAVWWMGATIRAERENCCDDTAVALTGNRLAYAKTLVRLQDLAHSAPTPKLALGIDGSTRLLRRRPIFLERIKRILQQPQQSTALMEKTIALAILAALVTFLTVRANTPPAFVETIREIAEKPVAWFAQTPQPEAAWQSATDTLPPAKKRQRIMREDDNQKVELELENGQISQLKIDGKLIAPENYGQYQALTDQLRDEAVAPAPPAPPMAPPPPGGWPAPAPGAAPFPPRASSRISTETDDKGNTIIRVERNGQPLEIRVKDGEVWVEDEKIEAGETMEIEVETDAPHFFWHDGQNRLLLDGHRFHFFGDDLAVPAPPQPGEPAPPHYFHFDQNGNTFLFKNDDGQVIEMPNFHLNTEELKRNLERSRAEMEKQRLQLDKQLKEHEKQMRKNRKEWEKHSKEQYRALQEARRELENAQREQERAMARARQDQQKVRLELERAQQEQQRALRHERSAQSFSSTVVDALLRDKLIDNPDNYTFELSKKEMRVNGKKQPDAVHEKYLAIYRKHSGKEISNDRVKIQVKN